MTSIKRSNTLGYKLDIGDVIWGYDSYESIESVEPLVSGVQLSSHINQIASNLTGDWLKDPQQAITNGHWIGPDVVPLEYTQGSEELAIYLLDGGSGGGAITASFGIDNHLAVWINGEYRFGAYSPIHFYENDLPFKEVDLGRLQPGINAIQILRSDQYGWAGADWEIEYDSDSSGPTSDETTHTPPSVSFSNRVFNVKDAGRPYLVSDYITTQDLDGDEIVWYNFYSQELPGSGYFTYRGTEYDGSLYQVPAEELDQVKYVPGKPETSEEIWIGAADTYQNSEWAKGIWSTAANQKPVGKNESLIFSAANTTYPLSEFSPITANDPDETGIAYYVFKDYSPESDSGYFVLDGVSYQGKSVTFTPEEYQSKLRYVSGNPGTKDIIGLTVGDEMSARSDESVATWATQEEEITRPAERPTLQELNSSYIGRDHLGKPFYKLQGDLWWGKNDARIIKSKKGDNAFSVKFYLGSKGRKSSGDLDNGKPTIVYSPGWQDSPSSPNSQNWWKKMYDKVGDSANLAIVDWSGMAEKTGSMVMPIFEATVTRQVGEVVADALIKAGAKPSDLTLVGHSLGSFVMGSAAMEIKRLTKEKVNEFIALDTAFGLSDIPNWFGNLFTGKQWSDYDTDVRPEANGMSPGEDLPYDFTSDLAKETYSFTVSDLSGLIGSSAGNNTRGATAMHPYIVQYTPTVEWTGTPAMATAYHNGTIGIYADLFAKDNIHPDSTYTLSTNKSFNARGEALKLGEGEFEGVIVAPQPWSIDVENRKAPNAIGWLDPDSDKHYPNIYGSSRDDFMLFDGFNNWVLGIYDTNKGVRLIAGDGNDDLASMQQDGKGVDTLIGGKGADVFHIGFSRYGQKIQPYKDKWDIDLFSKGIGSYVVIEDFKPKQKDKIIFGWDQEELGYKSISEFGISGTGTAFHVGGDLVAYVPTLDPGDTKTEKWINNPRYVEFVGKKYMTDFDSHLLNG